MIGTEPEKGELRKSILPVMAIVASIIAVLLGVTAVVFYSDLTQISPCDGGLGLSTCPVNAEFGLEQWDHGVFANGTYAYNFVLFPGSVYQVNTTSFSISFETSPGSNVTPASIAMYSLQGAELVTYHLSGEVWTAAQVIEVNLPSDLRLVSSMAMVDDNMQISDPTGHFTIGIGIT